MNGSDTQGSYAPAVPGPQPVVTSLLVAWLLVAVLQLVWKAFAGFAQQQLALDAPAFLQQGHFWQPFTAILVHGGLGQAILNSLVLWMFGGDLAREWRRGEFLVLVLVCGLCSSLCFLGLAASQAVGRVPAYPSPTGATFGVMAAYAVVFARRPLSLFGVVSMRARTLVILALAAQVLLFVVAGAWWVEAVAILAGAAAGYLLVKLAWWHTARRAGQAVGKQKGHGRFDGLEGMPDDSRKP